MRGARAHDGAAEGGDGLAKGPRVDVLALCGEVSVVRLDETRVRGALGGSG